MPTSPSAFLPVESKPGLLAEFVSALQPRHVVTVLVLLFLASLFTRGINAMVRRTLLREQERGTLLPETATRLHVSHRLINFTIWLIAIALGLTQFPQLRVLSAGLLASAGLSGLVVGFAAQSTLGNAIAGVTISFSQPVRIGDDIEVRGERGIVEDIALLFTVLRLADGKRMIVPNTTLSTEVLKNLSMGGVTKVARPEVLVPPRGDAPGIRLALLEVARAYQALDQSAAPPEVYWVRIDERGTLIRLVATCLDSGSADKLFQRVMARAAELVFHTPA